MVKCIKKSFLSLHQPL